MRCRRVRLVSRPLPAAVDVAAFIDANPVGAFQIRLLLLCAAVLFMDGFDTQAIGYVAPDLAKDWALPRGALGPVFASGLLGLMIGALTLGPIADRVGRKLTIVLSTAAFGLGSLATVLAQDLDTLLVLRFLTGLGLGGAMPNTVALMAELSPHRRRATLVMFMFCGFSVGAAFGGFVAAALIPAFGWRSVFVVGGVAPLLLVPLLLAKLPESARFLALTGREPARVRRLLRTLAPAAPLPDDATFVVREERLEGLPVAHLFRAGRTASTLLFWSVFFMSLLVLYLLSNWVPTVISDLGASVSTAALIGSMLQVGGVVATFVLGRLVDRFSFGVLALTYLAAAFALVALGLAQGSLGPTTVAIFAAGFCIIGGQLAANALAAMYYPTAVRSTGVGWCLGIGRIGSIVGPLIGGVILAREAETQLFYAAALPALLAAAAAFALARAARASSPHAADLALRS